MSIKDIAAAYEMIRKRDIRTLMVMEILHKHYEYVPIDKLTRWLGWDEGSVHESLKRLNKFSLVSREGGLGYRLTYGGYDMLAIHALAKKGIIESLSPSPIGTGKESDVYAARTVTGKDVVIKLHRLGRTSFRNVRRYRLWVSKHRHISWLYESRISAHMEYIALREVHRAGANVPKPISVNRHVVVMSYIDGYKLVDAQVDDPAETWKSIIESVGIAFDAGYIHGDLSEFNIMISEKPFLIDWPQWVPTTLINSIEYFVRDINSLSSFFAKRFDYRPDIDGIIHEYKDKLKNRKLGNPDDIYSEILDELIHTMNEETEISEK